MFSQAPASANTSIRTSEGFVWQFTIRANTGDELMQKMKVFHSRCTENNWIPEVRGTAPKREREYIQGKTCPKCSGRLYIGIKRDGTKFTKCENNRWINGQQSGCQYVEWPKEYN